MSLLARTRSSADAARELLDELIASSSETPPQRKKRLDSLRSSVKSVCDATDKMVAKADIGERDPNKAIYGKETVAKIRTLKADVSAIVEQTDEVAAVVEEEFVTYETERLRIEKEEAVRAERAKADAEAARVKAEKEEEERRAAEERAAAAKAEQERLEAKRIADEKAAAAKAAAAKAAEEKRASEEEARRKRLEAEASAKRESEQQIRRTEQDTSSSESVSITVKTSKGKSLPMNDLPPDLSIGDLKVRIEASHGIPAGAQRLIFQGRLLDEGTKLSERKIVSGVVVHLVENSSSRGSASARSANQPKPKVPPGTLGSLSGGKAELMDILGSCGSSRLAVLDFTAPWCPPCRAIAPVFERLATRFSDVTFVKIDTEQTPANMQLAQEFGISAYPTFQYYVGGSKVDEVAGANASRIESLIRKHAAQAASAASGSSSVLSGGSASGSGSQPSGALTGRVMAALGSLRSHVSNDDFTVAVRTLLTFVRNVTDHPHDPKYRRVRTGNQAYQTRLARHGSYGTECMKAFGFEPVVENGENFLVLSPGAASNPELRVVKTQLESAMQAAGVPSGAPASAPRAHVPPQGSQVPRFGPDAGLPGFGGMGGMPGGLPPGLDPAMAAELMADPSFMSMAQEFATNPELMAFSMRAQAAMQSGDPARMMEIASDPALMRLQQLMMQNPGLMQRMMAAGGGGGMEGMPGMAGLAQMMGGMPGTGTQGNGGTAGTVPGAGAAFPVHGQPQGPAGVPQAPGAAPTPAPAPVPGAPTTQEEEERLLQEAIRLSMEEANKKNDDKTQEGSGPDGSSQ